MKIPKTFVPDKSLEQKTEELKAYEEKKTSLDLHDLIYEYMGFTDFSRHNEHIHCVNLSFNEGTELLLDYENKATRQKELRLLKNAMLGLSDVGIKTTVKDPLEMIHQVFYENPLGYKSLSFNKIEFMLENDIILQKSRKNPPQLVAGLIIPGRMGFKYNDRGDHYSLNIGEFYEVVRLKEPLKERIKRNQGLKDKLFGRLTVHSLGIYEILPFIEKEKEILSGITDFEVSYRFPRPDDNGKYPDSGHLFRFKIRKEGNIYNAEMDIRAGFLDGLDLESVWPAKNMLGYINKEKKLVLNNQIWYKRRLDNNGWHCRLPI